MQEGYGKHAKTAWFIAPDNQPSPVLNDYYLIQYLFDLYSDYVSVRIETESLCSIHCHWIGFEDAEMKNVCNELN